MRGWNEFVAAWDDVLSLPLTALLLLLAALLTSGLWYFWPRWWHALLRMRWPSGRRRHGRLDVREVTDAEIEQVRQSEEELPNVAAAVFMALADRFAAQGRFAEAVRERLRAMVRELVDRGVITHHPGWTVTELAREAGAAKAAVAPPIDAASDIFTTIWYAKKPALSEHDTRMRALAAQLLEAMTGRRR